MLLALCRCVVQIHKDKCKANYYHVANEIKRNKLNIKQGITNTDLRS